MIGALWVSPWADFVVRLTARPIVPATPPARSGFFHDQTAPCFAHLHRRPVGPRLWRTDLHLPVARPARRPAGERSRGSLWHDGLPCAVAGPSRGARAGSRRGAAREECSVGGAADVGARRGLPERPLLPLFSGEEQGRRLPHRRRD